jgi:hypothetical protein
MSHCDGEGDVDDPAWLGGQLIFTRMTVTYPYARPPYPTYRSGKVTTRASYDPE